MESLLEYIRTTISDVANAKKLKRLAKQINTSMLEHEFFEELITWNQAHPYEKVRILESLLQLEASRESSIQIYCKNGYYRKLVHNAAEALGYYTQREGSSNTRMPGDFTPDCSVCTQRYFGCERGTPEFYQKTYRIDAVRVSKEPIKHTWKEYQHKKTIQKRRRQEKLDQKELKKRLHEELIAHYYEPGRGGYQEALTEFISLI